MTTNHDKLIQSLKNFCALNVGDTTISEMAWLQQINIFKESHPSESSAKGKPEKILEDLISNGTMTRLDTYSIKLNATVTRIDKYYK